MRPVRYLLATVALLAAVTPALAVSRPAVKGSREIAREARDDAKGDYTLVEEAIRAAHPEGKKRGNINNFIEDMAEGKTVDVKGTKVGLKQFEDAFEHGYGQRIEGQFRGEAVDAKTGKVGVNAHEWLPSNQMVVLIERAKATKDLRWTRLQDDMRTLTDQIILSPNMVHDKDAKGRWIPTGHDGAVYDNATKQAHGDFKNGSPLTMGQAAMHDELRKAIRDNQTIPGTIDAVEKVVRKWVWDGKLPKGLEVAPGVENDGKEIAKHVPEFQKLQAQRYEGMLKMIESMKVKYAKPERA